MEKVEKIKAGIERRIAEITDICQGYIADKQMKVEYLLLHELLSFIDSLSDTENKKEFKELAKPLNEWLQKNGHPNMRIIISFDGAEVVEGKLGVPFEILD